MFEGKEIMKVSFFAMYSVAQGDPILLTFLDKCYGVFYMCGTLQCPEQPHSSLVETHSPAKKA